MFLYYELHYKLIYYKEYIEMKFYKLCSMCCRDKMGDLPKIVSELWQVMGETGESIRQSILYLIDTVSFTFSVVIKS